LPKKQTSRLIFDDHSAAMTAIKRVQRLFKELSEEKKEIFGLMRVPLSKKLAIEVSASRVIRDKIQMVDRWMMADSSIM
jgi:hypothetical protein